MEPLLVSSILFVVLMVIWVFAHFLANLFTAMDNRGWSSNWWIGAQIAIDDLAEDYYRKPCNAFRRWRCKRARKYLLKHDSAFRHQEASVELIRQRKAFYDRGGSPESPMCPDIGGVLKDWGFSE